MKNQEFNKIANYAVKTIRKVKNQDYDYDFESNLYKKGIVTDLEILKNLNLKKDKVLDFGCGRGIFSLNLKKIFKKVYAIDVEPKKEDKKGELSGPLYNNQKKIWNIFKKDFGINFRFYKSPKIPFKDKTFDCVVAYAVLEHIPQSQLIRILKEINRILKPGGIFYVTRTPRNWSWAEKFVKSHEKLFSEKEIKFRLEEAGFKIRSFERTDFVPGFSVFKKMSQGEIGFHMLSFIDNIMLRSPLNFLAHHMRIVCRK